MVKSINPIHPNKVIKSDESKKLKSSSQSKETMRVDEPPRTGPAVKKAPVESRPVTKAISTLSYYLGLQKETTEELTKATDVAEQVAHVGKTVLTMMGKSPNAQTGALIFGGALALQGVARATGFEMTDENKEYVESAIALTEQVIGVVQLGAQVAAVSAGTGGLAPMAALAISGGVLAYQLGSALYSYYAG